MAAAVLFWRLLLLRFSFCSCLFCSLPFFLKPHLWLLLPLSLPLPYGTNPTVSRAVPILTIVPTATTPALLAPQYIVQYLE